MDLITPALGLIFWQTIIFLVVLFVLGKFAWKPILGALKTREKSIDEALKSAVNAKEEMANLIQSPWFGTNLEGWQLTCS